MITPLIQVNLNHGLALMLSTFTIFVSEKQAQTVIVNSPLSVAVALMQFLGPLEFEFNFGSPRFE